MFRVSQHPSSGVLKTVPAASATGHTTCTATPLQRGLIGTGLCESRAEALVLQPAYGYHTTIATLQRNTHRTRYNP